MDIDSVERCPECGKDVAATHWDRMCVMCDEREKKKAEAHIDGMWQKSQGMEVSDEKKGKAAKKRKPEEDVDPEADEETDDERSESKRSAVDEPEEEPKTKSAKRQKKSEEAKERDIADKEEKKPRKLAAKIEVVLVPNGLTVVEWKTEPLTSEYGKEDYQFVITNRGVVYASDQSWSIGNRMEFPAAISVYPKKSNLAAVENIKKLLAEGHTAKAYKQVENRGAWKIRIKFGRKVAEEEAYLPKFIEREERVRKQQEEAKRWRDFGEKMRGAFAEDRSAEATEKVKAEMLAMMTEVDRVDYLRKEQEVISRAVRVLLMDEPARHRNW